MAISSLKTKLINYIVMSNQPRRRTLDHPILNTFIVKPPHITVLKEVYYRFFKVVDYESLFWLFYTPGNQ